MTPGVIEWAARIADRFLGNVGDRQPTTIAAREQASASLFDGVVVMTLAALVASAAVLGASIWFVNTTMKGSGLGALGVLFFLAAGGGLSLVPVSAGLALHARGRPFATRTAWVLLNVFVIVGVLDSTVLSSLFFSEGLFIVLAVEVIVCCLLARAYTIWRATEGAVT
jgi:hypothetical protein